MNLSPCECEAELLWVCASPCVGEHTHLWLSALVGHFMSLCVNRNEILEWPFSRTLYFFYTLVSERQYSGALFFVFFLRYLLVFLVRDLWAAGIDARSLQFFLTNLTHESSWSHLISSAIRPCFSYVRLCGSKREKGAHRAPDGVLSLLGLMRSDCSFFVLLPFLLQFDVQFGFKVTAEI